MTQNNGSGWFYTHDNSGDEAGRPLPDTKRDSRAAVAGDFDGDGFVDLFVVNHEEENELLLNDGTGKFSLSEEAGDAVTTITRAMGVAAGDFDSDGDLDLLVVTYNDTNKLFWNDGAGLFTEDDDLDSPLTNQVTGSWTVTTGAFRVWISLLSRKMADGHVSSLQHTHTHTADFNGDGHLDIFEACSRVELDVEWEARVGTFIDPSLTPVDAKNSLYFGDGAGGFTLSTDPEAIGLSDTDTRGLVAADFNGDGTIDLYLANRLSDSHRKKHRLLINDGSGSFKSVEGSDATGVLSNALHATSCDIDGDGDLGELFPAQIVCHNTCSEN